MGPMNRSPADILNRLLESEAENEILEFKDRKNLSNDDMGEYFSALSNEANLSESESAWIVFGVKDKPREVVGSAYKSSAESLNKLKWFISENTTDNMQFRNVYEVWIGDKRVVMFEIPPAKPGVPTRFKRIPYGREGESKMVLTSEKYERIVRQTRPDWSASLVEDATIIDLDPNALFLARRNYKLRHPKLAEECDSWDDITFLNKAKVFRDGKATNTALLLLGKADSATKIKGADPRIRWIMRNGEGEPVAHEFFTIPFLVTIDDLLAHVRNYDFMVYRNNTLHPSQIKRYDEDSLREAINNAIAHQDYSKMEFITVVDNEDELVFINAGSFIPGTVQAAITSNRPSNYYRNRFLSEAMRELNMVDTIGSGIRRMFRSQKNRGFPMPVYVLSDEEVELTIPGKITDRNYADILVSMPSLTLEETIALDTISKGGIPDEKIVRVLTSKGLTEATGEGFRLLPVRELVDSPTSNPPSLHGVDACMKAILSYIEGSAGVTRSEINNHIMLLYNGSKSKDKIYNRISYVLKRLRESGKVETVGLHNHKIYRVPEFHDNDA